MRRLELKRVFPVLPAAVLLLLWCAVLWAGDAGNALLSFLTRLGSAGLFALSCTAVGRLLIRSEDSPGSRWLLSFSTGLIVYYHLIFFLGLIHAYYAPLLVVLAYAPAAGLLWHLRPVEVIRALGERIRLDKATGWLILACTAVGFYSFLVSLTPVTHYDALTNHLGIAAEYLSRGGIEPIPYNLHANLPPGAHMIFLPLIAGAGADAVQTFQFLLFLLLLPAFRTVIGADSPAWLIAWLLFALIPQVSLLLSLTNIDFLSTLYCLLSFHLCTRLLDTRAPQDRGVAGRLIFFLAAHLAFLFTLKYQAAIFVFLILGIASVRKPAAGIKTLLCVALFCSPFLIKNLLFTGDPVFPFAAGRFPVSETERAEAAVFVAANSHMPANPAVSDFARAFFRCFTRLPEAGVLSLIALLAAASLRNLDFRWKYLLAILSFLPVAIHVFLSLNVVNLIRWLQYCWAFLCLLGGLSVAALARRTAAVYAALILCLVASAYLSFTLNFRLTRSVLVGTGIFTPQEYRAMYIPSFQLRTRLESLPGKILFVGESRGYYNAQNSIIPSNYDYLYMRRYFDASTTAADLRRALLQDGIRYLYVSGPGLKSDLNDRLTWMDGAKLRMLQDLMRDSSLIGRDNASGIFQLRAQ